MSVRLDDRLADRMRLRAQAAGESLSDRLRRYAEEGTRRDEHPMITFRDGPTGRRAGLIAGHAYADEIQARIDLHRSETAAAEAR